MTKYVMNDAYTDDFGAVTSVVFIRAEPNTWDLFVSYRLRLLSGKTDILLPNAKKEKAYDDYTQGVRFLIEHMVGDDYSLRSQPLT